ncbi:GspMb/PilO family protein [Rhizobacter sp. J219]|uniref:GspMb/PilO family protein n=1 Tax=Rhizobacter sp. J219 TaxID=2898430 RepID=UPI002151E5E5|nr:GspMb/PilO family protein [Rhizobacter sp. J219]MCR5881417.1 GspMb/PilO family protein [Rhizobacter sp. J219]
MFVARGTTRFGRTGWLGLALLVVAGVWFAQIWGQHQQPVALDADEPALVLPAAPVRLPATQHGMSLARENEQALLLTQIQQVAVSQGLSWAAADYKVLPAGEATPASVEVRCTLKGTYPRLRGALAQWVQQVPGLAIRDLSLSRTSSDVADVEAKLQLVVFMRSESAEGRP